MCVCMCVCVCVYVAFLSRYIYIYITVKMEFLLPSLGVSGACVMGLSAFEAVIDLSSLFVC